MKDMLHNLARAELENLHLDLDRGSKKLQDIVKKGGIIMNGVREIKFEMMLEDIYNDVYYSLGAEKSRENIKLNLIFDYASCNEYSKKILEKLNAVEPPENKMEEIKDFIKQCREDKTEREGFRFVFWAFIILAVDGNNADEKIMEICDIAEMIGISEKDIADIVYIVKCICSEESKNHRFSADKAVKVFGKIVKTYCPSASTPSELIIPEFLKSSNKKSATNNDKKFEIPPFLMHKPEK